MKIKIQKQFISVIGGRNYYVTTKEELWICRNLADAESIKETHGGSITNFYIHLCTICQN